MVENNIDQMKELIQNQIIQIQKDRELDSENTDEAKFSQAIIRRQTGLVGLKNFGASWYMNSVLQWLLNTSGFAENIKYNYLQILQREIKDHDQVMLELVWFIDNVKKNLDYESELETLYDAICSTTPLFQKGQHWDASELLAILLEKLETYFKENNKVYDFFSDFASKIEQKIICTNCGMVCINHETTTSIGLPAVTENTLNFSVIKLSQDYSISNNYSKEYQVECEIDATVEQIKQKLGLQDWEFLIVLPNGLFVR